MKIETRKKLSEAAKKQWSEGRGPSRNSRTISQASSKRWEQYNSALPFEKRGKKFRFKALIEKHGNKCMLCGQAPFWNSKFLVLQEHHIDGDSKNNAEENLQVVCPNCHSQTDNFTGKNVKQNSVQSSSYDIE